MKENYKEITNWKKIVIKEYWMAVLRRFLEDSQKSEFHQLEDVINGLFRSVKVMDFRLNVLMRKELYEDHKNEEHYFTLDSEGANEIHYKQKGETLTTPAPGYNYRNYLLHPRDRESRIKYLENKIKSYDIDAIKKEEAEKLENIQERNNNISTYDWPSLDDLVGGDEQMLDWYNSNENN